MLGRGPVTASTGEEKIQREFGFPYSGLLLAEAGSALNGGEYTAVEQAHSFTATALVVDVVRSARSGRGLMGSNGALVFSVDTLTTATVSGGFSAVAPSTNEQFLSAELFDLTAGTSLMESVQWTASPVVDFSLGGMSGNRLATFSGSLTNALAPGHVYRLTYSASNQAFGAGSGGASATGFIAITAVPEPSTAGLLLVGVGLLTFAIRPARTLNPPRVQSGGDPQRA